LNILNKLANIELIIIYKSGGKKMDLIDTKILNILKNNARITASELSKKVNLSLPAVLDRIKKMEASKIIEKYTVKLNREALNYKLLVFIFVAIEKTKYINNFRNSIINMNVVLECHHLAGEYDYLLKVIVQDTQTLETFISDSLKKIPGIVKTNTIIALSSLKEEINV
jgi:Lrp/AsnC family leucine-responsive transcriptional regulator